MLCAAGAVALAAGAAAPIVGSLVALAMLVVPGVFVVDRVAPRDGVERLVTIWGVSLTSWMLVAHVALSLRWWQPRLIVGVALSVAALVALRPRVVERRRPAASTLVAGVLTARWQLAIGAAALAVWALSLRSIDLDALGGWGLITELPPAFFIAFVLAVALAAAVASSAGATVGKVAVGVAPLLVIIYGTLPLLAETIRYPWSYKHIGVIRLLDETGQFHPDVDIYNNFSGFFGLIALHRGATDVDPTSYAAWTQLVAEAIIVCAVWLLARRVTDSARVAHIAAVLYVITNWVGQNYFAAQTLGSFLGLSVLALVASWFLGGETRRFRGLGRRVAALAPSSSDEPSVPLTARRAVVLLIAFGLLMAHPLTPAAYLGAIAAAAVIGWVRDRALLAGFVAVAVVWYVRCLPYFVAQDFDLGFGGSPTENADGADLIVAPPAAVEWVGILTRGYSLALWMLAAVGAVAAAWAMRRAGMVVLAASIPFGILVAQSYGGEAIYRVYLYSLPLVVSMVAWGIASRSSLAPRAWLSSSQILTMVIASVLAAGFLVAHYGREQINHVDPSEVAMGEYIDAEIPDPAVLAQLDGAYPAAGTARYPSFQVNDTYVPMVVELLDDPRPDRLPTPTELDEVADDLIGLDAGVPFLIVSPGMIDSIEHSGALPLDSTDDAVAMLLTSERFVVRHHIDSTWLLEVLP